MMRVLWFCNRQLSAHDTGGTGTWLNAMAQRLLASCEVDLAVVAPGNVSHVQLADCNRVRQWLVPGHATPDSNGLPPRPVVDTIVSTVTEWAPDLVHIWGTENYWGLLTARGLLPGPALLEMQGIKSAIADVFFGGLSAHERLACIGPKEIIKRRTLAGQRLAFARWGRYEREMMAGHRFIGYPSPWIAAHVRAASLDARLFPGVPLLRPLILSAAPWTPSIRPPVLFCAMAYPSPFKGLHVAIRALALLRQRLPEARLRVAGALQRPGLRQDGYMRWVNRLLMREGLLSAVEWLGPLTGPQLVDEMHAAAAAVVPTFVESYGLSMAEPLALGLPVASAFVGGTSFLGRDEETCLFFPAGDAAACAYQLERLLTDPALAARLSIQARDDMSARNDPIREVNRQIGVYREVIAAHRNSTA